MVSEDITEILHDALKHIGDAVSLAESPLVKQLGIESANPGAALHLALVDAIEMFRPVAVRHLDEKDRRRYEILHGCFVAHLTQDAVAQRLGISSRHLRREQEQAIQALAKYLLMRFGLRGTDDWDTEPSRQNMPTDDRYTDMNRELLWLVESSLEETAEVMDVVTEAVRVARALAEERDVALHVGMADSDLGMAAVPSTVLRQAILLTISGVARFLPPGSSTEVTVSHERDQVVIAVVARSAKPLGIDSTLAADDAIASARRLLELFSGNLTVSSVGDILVASLSLPLALRQTTVLAIEDNVHTLRMWQRFLQKTAFQLVGEPDALRAVETAAELGPDLVLLDVMLGGTDGWEVLRRLRSHPKTAAVPVVVCSVLPQEELALSLGANGFILKPVTGQAFRAALGRQISVEGSQPKHW